LRDHIQRIAIKRPAYGYRRITEELHRDGQEVNHKRVLRIMREDNLLCLRTKGFLVTTDSDHALPIYPNLAKDLLVTAPDQLWVGDITYIRLLREFIYLAVLLDVFSRQVIGWELGRRLHADLPLAALENALATRNVLPGLVHHSDRGVQYACMGYTQRLLDRGIQISMSRRGNPYDNAYAESFMKTLKYEEVYLTEYADLNDAQARISQFLDDYNHARLHSALGYRPPAEFEALSKTPDVQEPKLSLTDQDSRSTMVLDKGRREGSVISRSVSSFNM
jgi:transposase InsO family protein